MAMIVMVEQNRPWGSCLEPPVLSFLPILEVPTTLDRHREIHSFALVAMHGSFAAAARVEGVTPAVMGRRLDALERRLGVKLIHRSTRGLTLTDLGTRFLADCQRLLREFDTIEDAISIGQQQVRGHLSVTAPAAFGRRHIGPHVPAFRARHPLWGMSFHFTDDIIDLVRDGYDLAVRVGTVLEPDYVALSLYPNRRVVCGAPAYFARHGHPQIPEDLLEHNCLALNVR